MQKIPIVKPLIRRELTVGYFLEEAALLGEEVK